MRMNLSWRSLYPRNNAPSENQKQTHPQESSLPKNQEVPEATGVEQLVPSITIVMDFATFTRAKQTQRKGSQPLRSSPVMRGDHQEVAQVGLLSTVEVALETNHDC